MNKKHTGDDGIVTKRKSPHERDFLMLPVLHLPHILRERSQRYPVARYGHADHVDAPAQPCKQFRELLLIDLHGRTPRTDAAKLRQVSASNTEDEHTELAVDRQFLQSSLQLPVPGAGRYTVRHHDKPGLVEFHPVCPVGTLAAVEFGQGQLDGFTQERTSAREEYTPAFDLTGV